MFSRRTSVPRAPNALATALEDARRSGATILDLTVSNPTRAGLDYDPQLLDALAHPGALTYTPDPKGLRETREAVARLYREDGLDVDPEHLVLTASTSEAYSFLFKLLADPGDELLVPHPSYPLFDYLARFEEVTLAPYPLDYDGAWHLDAARVRARMTPKTRAVMVVSPNNPTGSYMKSGELAALAELGVPIVSDEVFAPFPLKGPARGPSVLAVREAPLVFALGGLSKLAALPQMKLGWIAVGGSDGGAIAEALARLELIADAFLSVATPVQLAAGALLAGTRPVRAAIRARAAEDLDLLASTVRDTPCTLLDVEGGWYATLRLPRVRTEEEWALGFLEEDSVYVHPGQLFDFQDEAYVVLSLLTPPAVFSEGAERIARRVALEAGLAHR